MITGHQVHYYLPASLLACRKDHDVRQGSVLHHVFLPPAHQIFHSTLQPRVSCPPHSSHSIQPSLQSPPASPSLLGSSLLPWSRIRYRFALFLNQDLTPKPKSTALALQKVYCRSSRHFSEHQTKKRTRHAPQARRRRTWPHLFIRELSQVGRDRRRHGPASRSSVRTSGRREP